MEFIFPYISFASALIVIWFMPKHLSRKEIYITWGWLSTITVFTDLSFGVILDLYDFGKSPKVDFADLPLQAALAPAVGIIVLNFMPKTTKRFVYYFVAVVLFSLFYEWVSTLTSYLVYKGWKLYYSLPFYFLGTLYLRWHLNFLRKS